MDSAYLALLEAVVPLFVMWDGVGGTFINVIQYNVMVMSLLWVNCALKPLFHVECCCGVD